MTARIIPLPVAEPRESVTLFAVHRLPGARISVTVPGPLTLEQARQLANQLLVFAGEEQGR